MIPLWDGNILEMYVVLNSFDLPPTEKSCENCAYSAQRAIVEHVKNDTII